MLRRILLASAAFLFVSGAMPVSAQTEIKDHPLVSRFQGSTVIEHRTVAFDQFVFALGPITGDDTFVKSETLEGKVTAFRYTVPAGHSSLEVARSYENALHAAGFQVLYKCDGGACISEKFRGGYTTNTASGIWCRNCAEPMHYVGAKLTRPEGDAYISMVVTYDGNEGRVGSESGAWLTIVEPKPIGIGQVTVNATAMNNSITQVGHVALYGIYFDTGKATLTAASDPTLAEIAKALAANPRLKLHVVGHTDNVGTLATNITLSKQRADAVVAALVTQHHIAAGRLDTAGVGPLAPVATNRTDDGRAKNRRVELVEQ